MCTPNVMRKVAENINKLSMLGLLGATTMTVPHTSSNTKLNLRSGFKVHDLTHTLSAESPLYPGYMPMETQERFTRENNGYFVNRICYDEHSGTHVDAPAHFADGVFVDQIPVEQLVAPLAVIDISERTLSDEDAQVMPDDILAWERQHGRLPNGAFVAMYSGWDQYIDHPEKFLNKDDSGTLHFPGFHASAAEMLVRERSISGIGVDTLSLDFGPSADFIAHLHILSTGAFGVETLASLGGVSPSGALIVVGAPKVKNGSGGPARVMALV